MQATVSAFDPETRSGSVLLDDGVELSFSGAAMAHNRLRFLRPGQRVRLAVHEADGVTKVTALQIVTLAD
jgi:hypothetical protein